MFTPLIHIYKYICKNRNVKVGITERLRPLLSQRQRSSKSPGPLDIPALVDVRLEFQSCSVASEAWFSHRRCRK